MMMILLLLTIKKAQSYTIEPRKYNLNTIGINGSIKDHCKISFKDWLFAIVCDDYYEVYDNHYIKDRL